MRVVGFSVLTDMCMPGVVADAQEIYNMGVLISKKLIPLIRESIPLFIKDLE